MFLKSAAPSSDCAAQSESSLFSVRGQPVYHDFFALTLGKTSPVAGRGVRAGRDRSSGAGRRQAGEKVDAENPCAGRTAEMSGEPVQKKDAEF